MMERDKEKYYYVPDSNPDDENSPDTSSIGEKIDRSLFEVEIDQNPFEPKVQFQDLIKTWDNALDPEFCDHCIRKYEEDPYKYQGEVSAGAFGDTKRSVDLTITDKDHWASEDKVFADCLTPKIGEYINNVSSFGQSFGDIFRLNAVASKFYDCGYQIQRTKPGDFYIWHNDFSLYQGKYPRYLTFIWYLNDIIEDGYTEFSDGTRIQPKQGTMIMFPATWTYGHRGYPPKYETKYICTGWVHSTDNPS